MDQLTNRQTLIQSRLYATKNIVRIVGADKEYVTDVLHHDSRFMVSCPEKSGVFWVPDGIIDTCDICLGPASQPKLTGYFPLWENQTHATLPIFLSLKMVSVQNLI